MKKKVEWDLIFLLEIQNKNKIKIIRKMKKVKNNLKIFFLKMKKKNKKKLI